jgi:hypothetical protein
MPSRALRLWFCLLSALLCASLSSAWAQTPVPTPAPVQMALSSPFARTVKPLDVMGRSGKWVPLAVTLSNTGDPVVGQLQLQLSTGTPGNSFDYPSNTATTTVDLPTNSRKVVWLYARLDRPDVGGFDVSFSGRGINVPTQSVPVRQPDSEQREVMIVSDTDIGLNDTLRSLKAKALFRAGQAPNNPSGAGQSPVIPFSFGRADVPDRWIGFESADLVVLGDFPHSALSPQQIDALRGYVQGGGTLVVLGGANAARLASSPLKDLWPIIPTTSVPASPSEVAGLVSNFVDKPQNGADRLGGAPVVVTRGTLSPDATLEDGTTVNPLYATRDTGAGRVLFLAYDPSQPPFKGWSGQGKLWRDLFVDASHVRTLESVDADFLSYNTGMMAGGGAYSPPSNYGQDAPSSATGLLLDAVSKAPQLRMPPVSRIAWFLALYVFFLVPLNYAVLRIIDRRELAWVTIPAIVVAFSVLAYTEALSIRGRAILTRQMDIVQSTVGSKAGRVDTLFWLFSPRTTNYVITSGGQQAALNDFANKAGGEQGAFSIEQPADGSGFRLPDAPLRIWTDRAFASQSLGNLSQGVSFQGQSLRNNTGVDLYGAVWVQDNRVSGLGEIKNGASVPLSRAKSQRFGADISGAIVNASKLDAVFDSSSRANGIPRAALTAALGDSLGKLNPPAMLIAWGKRSVAPFSIGLEAAQGREMTLFVIRVPLKLLPKTLAAREATVQRVSFDPFTPGDSPSQGGFAFYDCQVPATSSLTLTARGTGIGATRNPGTSYGPPKAGAGQVRIEAWDPGAVKWQPLKGKTRLDPSPAGGWNFSATVPSNWVRRPSNSLRVRVRLDTPNAQVSSLRVEG